MTSSAYSVVYQKKLRDLTEFITVTHGQKQNSVTRSLDSCVSKFPRKTTLDALKSVFHDSPPPKKTMKLETHGKTFQGLL